MRQSRWSLPLGAALVVVFAGTALATSSSGMSVTALLRGTLSESIHLNVGDVKFQTKAPVDLVTRGITFAVGATSGWHSHPGIVLVTVVSGSLVVYGADCSSEPIPAGTVFVESGDEPGLVRNEGSIDAVTSATFIVPAGTPNSGLRIDRDNPGCPGLN
jgi:hypothetical protein